MKYMYVMSQKVTSAADPACSIHGTVLLHCLYVASYLAKILPPNRVALDLRSPIKIVLLEGNYEVVIE